MKEKEGGGTGMKKSKEKWEGNIGKKSWEEE